MTTISFPAFKIGELVLDPAAIRFSESFAIYWSGILIAVGALLAFFYAFYRTKTEGLKFDDLIDTTLFGIIFGVVGARLLYVLTTTEQMNGFLDVIAIWNGGLAIYGAIIGGGIAIAVTCRLKGVSVLKSLDVAASSLMIGQIIGRLGDFFNGQSYGITIAKDSPLYFIRMGISPHVFEDVKGLAFVHPTFLYEMLWNIIGFAIIHFIYKKKKFDGQIMLMYLAWYGLGRSFIEGLRMDSLYIGVFRVSQVLGFISFITCTIILVFQLTKAYRKKKDGEEYAPTFKKISNPASLFMSDDAEEEYTPAFKVGNTAEESDDEQKNDEENEVE